MVRFECLAWRDLDRDAVYDVLTLRQLVFSVEQTCAYLDCDGVDPDALHLLGRLDGGELAAYARLIPPGRVYGEASIGRVVTHPWARKAGLGRALMAKAVAEVTERFGGPIRIGAQRYLERFYGELGFVTASEPYIEDGIPHILMVRPG